MNNSNLFLHKIIKSLFSLFLLFNTTLASALPPSQTPVTELWYAGAASKYTDSCRDAAKAEIAYMNSIQNRHIYHTIHGCSSGYPWAWWAECDDKTGLECLVKSSNIQNFCPTGYHQELTETNDPICVLNDQLTEAANGKPSSCVGNPIDVVTGNKYQKETDYLGNGLHAFEFSRFYNSQSTDWTHSYSHHLKITGGMISGSLSPSEIKVMRPDGKAIYFYRAIVGATTFSIVTRWKAADPTKDQLYSLSAEYDPEASPFAGPSVNQWVLTTPETIETYSPEGQLTSITSVEGAYLNLSTGDHLNYFEDRIEVLDADYALLQTFYTTGTFLVKYIGNEMRVTNPVGKVLSIWYADLENELLDYIILPDTRRIYYEYDLNNYLEYVYAPDQTPLDLTDNDVKQYHYTAGRLSGITDERGIRYATWTYDGQQRAQTSYHGPDEGVNMEIDRVDITYLGSVNGSRIVTDSRGNETTYETTHIYGKPVITKIEGCASCGISDVEYDYDDNGNINFKTEHAIRTDYGNYNTKGNPGYKIDASGTSESRRKDYEYDSRFIRKITQATEPSVVTSLSKVSSYTYDDFGNTTTIIIAGFTPDSTAVSRTTHLQYNGPFHQLSQIDGPRIDVNDIITLDYYPNEIAQGNNRARLRSVSAYDGTFLRNNIQYTVTGKIDSEDRTNNLHIDYYYYSGNDRLYEMTETDSISGKSRTSRWTYLATGEIETITQGAGSIDETELTLSYDDARRLTRITDSSGNYIEYILDSEGNLEQENIRDGANILKKKLAQTFDAYNRLDNFSEKNQDINYDYNADGTLNQITDGKGIITDYDYDSLKRLIRITEDLNGTNPDTANTLTQYGYDTQDNLTSVTDANNGETTYTYDDLGNLLSQTSPDTGTTLFTHDEAGNIITRTDAKGQLFYYSYDAFNRLTSIDAPVAEDDVTFIYDSCTQGYGRICQVQRQNSTLSHSYNGMGEITEIDQHLITWAGYNQASSTIAYSYDNAARLKTITYPSGAIVSYGYDVTGQIERVDLDQNGVATNLFNVINRFPFGTINNATFGNGQSYFSYTHNDYRTWVIATAGQYTTIYYDKNGNPGLMYYPQGQGALSYDALQRLDTATGSLGNFDYDYDKVGNKTHQAQNGASTSMSYDVNSNRMNTLGSITIDVDPNGNTTGLRGMTLSFTSDNRLKNINTGVAFEYDGLGQRSIKKISSPGIAGTYGYSQSKTYLYGQKGKLLAETGPTGKVVKEYVYLDGKPLIMLEHSPDSGENFLNGDMDNDGTISVEDFLVYYFNHGNSTDPAYDVNGDGIKDSTDNSVIINCGLTQGNCEAASYSTSLYYIHNDHLGTPKSLTNESGTKVWQATATPFGKATVNNDVDGDGIAVEMNLRQPGQYYDRESGLYYNYYRYYDPETGRYITSDPIGLAGGINTYAYVENNPLKYIDPLGLETQLGVSFNATLFGGPLAFPNGGLSGGVTFGVSLPDSFSDWGNIQLYTQVQANGLAGAGWFAGGGASGVVGSTNGTLPSCSTSTSLHLEANAGWGRAAGGSVDFNQDGGGVTYSGRPFTGAGYGVMTAGGVGTTTTYATPTLRQVLNRFLR